MSAEHQACLNAMPSAAKFMENVCPPFNNYYYGGTMKLMNTYLK